MHNYKLLLALSLGAAALVQTAAAQIVVTRSFSFPPVGLASSETLQVNVSNVAASAANGTAAACAGNVSFFNAAGTAIGTATTFSVAAGVTQSIPLTFAKSGLSGVRGEVRAVIQTTSGVGRNAAPCSLESSLETFDSTLGVTHVYLSSAINQSTSAVGFATTNSGASEQ
jgi:hypothetical protein